MTAAKKRSRPPPASIAGIFSVMEAVSSTIRRVIPQLMTRNSTKLMTPFIFLPLSSAALMTSARYAEVIRAIQPDRRLNTTVAMVGRSMVIGLPLTEKLEMNSRIWSHSRLSSPCFAKTRERSSAPRAKKKGPVSRMERLHSSTFAPRIL